MEELYELKDTLIRELAEYGSSKEMSAGSLDVVDKLAHATKNLCKIIDDMDGHSHSSYDNGMGSRYGRGNSYSRGRYSRRYMRDGYSGNDDMAMELRAMMDNAPDDRTRQEFQKFITKIEQM